MPNDHLSLSKSSLAFAKLASTPTEKAWSQAYNAGNLFACLSLNSNADESLHVLQTLGKELFSNLEAEFFTLEEKNLTTITGAIQTSIKHIPETVSVDFCLAYFKDTTLYIFILGESRVIMKRGEKLGVLLEGKKEENSIATASGYLQNNDTIILETNKFANNISDQHLSDSLELSLPSDIAEALSVHMHEKADGDQAAIIISYHGVVKPPEENLREEEEDATLADIQTEEEIPPVPSQPIFKLPKLPSLPRLPKLPYFHLNHRKKFFLSISVIILALLLISIFLTKQKQDGSKNKEVFDSIYTPALKSYEEAKGLENLNATLSHEDFQKAEKLLSEGRDKFPQGSKEDQQIEELLAKVQAELGGASESSSTAKEVTLGKNSLLAAEIENASGTGFSQNDDNVYFITNSALFSIDKTDGKKTELIKNDENWQKAVATAPFQTNLYVLDTGNGILKFVPSGDSFSKNDYLKSSTDLNRAVAMAIDSAVWVLFSDGSIKKFLRGEAESFSIKSLDKPFVSPSKIATDADTDNLYILDQGNSRVVVLGKDGAFQKQYSAGIIKQAKDFEVLEKDKKINILSGDKTYQLTLD